MSKQKHFSRYKSPNIVIIPNPSLCNAPSPKRQKLEVPEQNQSPQQVDISFLDDFNIDEIVECLNNCDRVDNIQELNNNDEIEVDKTSFISNSEEVIILNKEILTSYSKCIDNSEGIGSKFDKNESATKDIQNITFDLAMNNKNGTKPGVMVENILNSEAKINVKEAIESVENNLQPNKVVIIDNNKIQSIGAETEHFDVQINLDVKEGSRRASDLSDIKDLDNKDAINTEELEEIKKDTIISIINNTDTQNKLKNGSLKSKNIENSNEDIISSSNSAKNIFFKKPTNNEKSVSLPKSKIQYKSDVHISKLLEERMYNYLHVKYSMENVVHSGKFSKIFKCKDAMGKHYAVKMLKQRSDRLTQGIKKEEMLLEIQADIPKENLFCVYFVNSFSLNGFWCFLMDYHPINLKQVIEESERPFHIDLVQDLARQLVSAVTLLRNRNIIHSDIKPSHILLNNSHTILKLCGFDRSYYFPPANIAPNIGTVNYRPPEIILGYAAGFCIDVWTTALVLYEMTTGHKLFHGFNNWNILYKQVITLGSIPPKMLYGCQYFDVNLFKKKFGFKGRTTLSMHKFIKSDKLSRTLYGSYYHHWGSIRSKTEKNKDIQKIKSLINLLDKMLVIWPNHRITIEFVYANPFIYETFAL